MVGTHPPSRNKEKEVTPQYHYDVKFTTPAIYYYRAKKIKIKINSRERETERGGGERGMF